MVDQEVPLECDKWRYGQAVLCYFVVSVVIRSYFDCYEDAFRLVHVVMFLAALLVPMCGSQALEVLEVLTSTALMVLAIVVPVSPPRDFESARVFVLPLALHVVFRFFGLNKFTQQHPWGSVGYVLFLFTLTSFFCLLSGFVRQACCA